MTTRTRTARPPEGAILVADLATGAALEGARLLPNAWPLDRPVRAVVLADADGPEEADAVVVCPGSPPEELPAGCVAVVCRAAPASDPGVPVFVLRAGTPWGPVVAGLVAEVAGGAAGARAAAARAAFRTPLVAGEGLPGLAAVAAGLLGAPVALLDEYLDIRACEGLGDDDEAFLDAAVARARGHGPASIVGPFVEEVMPGISRAVVHGAGTAVIGVVVAWVPSPLSPAQEAVVGELGEAMAVERGREEVRTETESRLRGDLIEELMAGEVVSRESLVRRARHLGADLSGGGVALIGKLQDPHTEGRVITDPRLVRRFMQQARAAMDLHWPRSLIDWSDGRLLALLPRPAGAAEAERDEIEAQALVLGRRLLGATRETVPGLALTLALSRWTPEPERLGVALDEARLALSIGERLGRIGEVVTFEETGTYKLLFQIFADHPEELTAFYEGTIAPLVRYDEQYQTELVGTLSTYLGHDCNLAATASTLYTHRHTVRYRLDRIAELSGLDIAKTDDREKLSLGLKAMRLLGRRVTLQAERGGARASRGR